MSGLSKEQIEAILAKGSNVATSVRHNSNGKASQRLIDKFPRENQVGPLRWRDSSMRCASRGCGSETHCTVEGIPYCLMHTCRKLNELYVKLDNKDFDGPELVGSVA